MQERRAVVTAVGPVGYDDIDTPGGAYRRLLGGSAVFFALAAAALAPTRIVSIVGDDLADEELASLAACGVDVRAVRREPGRSHHWAARYDADLASARTLENDLGVLAGRVPELPELRAGDILFIGSLEPATQDALRRRAPAGIFTILDTQSHWIAADPEGVRAAARGVVLLCVNGAEARQLAGAASEDEAAAALLGRGCGAVVVKTGSGGATLHHAGGRFACPSLPLRSVADPTGAGDAFAGGMAGCLATAPRRDATALADALRYGVACATLRLELPAGERVACWTRGEIERRAAALAVVRT